MKVLNIIISIFTLGVCWAQNPVIKFEKSEIELGVINESETPTNIVFNFKNTGNKDLVIENVETSCGCILVSYPENKIKPDSSGVLKVSVNTKNRPGFFNKSITINANTQPDITVLTIKGVVRAKPRNLSIEFPVKKGNLYFETNGINIGTVTTDKPAERTIEVYNDLDHDITLVNKIVCPSHIKLSDKYLVFKSKQVTDLKFTYDAKLKNDFGYVSDYLELYTNETSNNMIPLSVFGNIEQYFPKMSEKELEQAPKINISKKEVYLGRYSKGTEIEGSVTISNIGVKDLKINKIKANCPCVSATMNSDLIHKDESVLLSFKINTQELLGVNNKTIVVYNNDPMNPVLILNVKFDIY
ncbi:MAG: DUF1573 domain-containing protein [Cytophagales bacterium]